MASVPLGCQYVAPGIALSLPESLIGSLGVPGILFGAFFLFVSPRDFDDVQCLQSCCGAGLFDYTFTLLRLHFEYKIAQFILRN